MPDNIIKFKKPNDKQPLTVMQFLKVVSRSMGDEPDILDYPIFLEAKDSEYFQTVARISTMEEITTGRSVLVITFSDD